jgi:hypothetical protein
LKRATAEGGRPEPPGIGFGPIIVGVFAIAGGVFAHLWSQSRDRENRREQTRRELYLAVIALILEDSKTRRLEGDRGDRSTAFNADALTCFMFFGQLILLFWTAQGELSDVEERFREVC